MLCVQECVGNMSSEHAYHVLWANRIISIAHNYVHILNNYTITIMGGYTTCCNMYSVNTIHPNLSDCLVVELVPI